MTITGHFMDYQNHGGYGVGTSNHKKFINFIISQVESVIEN